MGSGFIHGVLVEHELLKLAVHAKGHYLEAELMWVQPHQSKPLAIGPHTERVEGGKSRVV
jgi:hypothetical protein